MKQLLPVICLSLCALSGRAQLTWTIYNTGNSGIGNNFVYDIAQDAQGNKWFGVSFAGVRMFDGTTWTSYTTGNSGLPNNEVISVGIDGLGNKWFGTYGSGVAKFDGTNWTVYNTGNSGLVNNYVQHITHDALGNIWLATSGGVSVFNGTTWTNYTTGNSGLTDNEVTSITVDAQGNKWIGTSMGGMCKFDGATWTNYTYSNTNLSSLGITTTVIDAAGRKWFGTPGGGVTVYNDTTWTTYKTQNSGLLNNIVTAIGIEVSGTKWMATADGISKFNGTTWTNYTTGNSPLPSNNVEDVIIDAQGDKWFATLGGGVVRISGWPLSVDLLSFSGETQKSANTLRWQTAAEKGNAGFSIEKSSDGSRFETIGFVTAAAGEGEGARYSFTDQHPLPGKNCYRLKIQSRDGSADYSSILTLEGAVSAGGTARLYPSPARTSVTFATSETGAQLYIYDLTGRLQHQQTIGHEITEINVSSLPAGMYLYSYGDWSGSFVKE